MFYRTLKKSVGIFFNIFNLLLKGNLPPLGCVCILVEQDGRYLIVERPEGLIVFPGGFMRWKELSEQTAKREGKEETGLDLRIGDILGCYTTPSHDFKAMSTITIVHRAEVMGGTLRSSIEGVPYWVDKETLCGRLEEQYHIILNDHLHCEKQVECRKHGKWKVKEQE
ncbi:MAG: hypothetical protein PVS3B3_09100 [Ktedonobacteraceae bacterium]